MFSPDKMTTLLGVGLGALHQVGVVGTIPSTKDQWMGTLFSFCMILLGYFTNKTTPA